MVTITILVVFALIIAAMTTLITRQVYGPLLTKTELDKLATLKLDQDAVQPYKDMTFVYVEDKLHYIAKPHMHWANPFSKWYLGGGHVTGRIPRRSVWTKKLDIVEKVAHN
jgi:hypothetical protein